MKLNLTLLAAVLLAPLGAQAAPTQIAQLPLLNVTGTGLVKPNLMLLYDNSGSMASTFTPDYIDDGTSCRKGATMANGTRACQPGHPPYNSPDFNKQYYNPDIEYAVPVRADSSLYPSMNRANTTGWTVVSTDGFLVNTSDLRGNAVATTNIATGFPDYKWCTSTTGTSCAFNSATYTYPNATYANPISFNTNPYYYQINTAEWCSDSNLTSCVTTAVGAPAPAGRPYPAKVRWCNSTALTNCQARYVGAYIYPRYSNPNGGAIASYGTLTIGSSNTAASVNINSVTVAETGGPVVITNGVSNASTGTNTTAKQAALANLVAASIVARTGLTNTYTACVRTPTGSVPACSTFGISLPTDNIVAVVPLDCTPGATTKTLDVCSVLVDDTRSGWGITVDAPQTQLTFAGSPTAIMNVAGTSHMTATPNLASMSLGSTVVFGSPGKNLPQASGPAAIVASLKASIGTVGTIRPYIGGDAAGGPVCQGYTSSSLCLVDSAAVSGGANITVGALSNNLFTTNKGNVSFTFVAASPRTVDSFDAIPVTTAALSTGNAVFVRTDIVPSRTTYPRGADRTDCVSATVCTYDEEMTNFANWFAYYKTRNQMMKSAVGRAFDPVSASFKVGVVSLSTAAAEGSMTPPRVFSGANRTDFYTRLYAMNGNNSTPLRQALNAVGKMYGNRSPYNMAVGSEVVQYPCEQNFIFMTTDGYWNGGAAGSVASNDEVDDTNRFCTLSNGCVDPRPQGNDNSLADVASFWYNGGFSTYTANTNSLRPSLEDWTKPGLVSGGPGENHRLHVTTYTLGLGVDGIMTYDPRYNHDPAAGTDFYNLINRVTTGCPWNGGGAYVWPDPVTSDTSNTAYQSRVDDLWHAAVNGHGKYFSAADPTQVIDGLRDALSSIEATVGAAAAAATSTPNISQEDNDIFSDTFTTVKWYGELSDKKINIITGDVIPAPVWLSSDQVGRKVANNTDTRTLKMLDTVTGNLKDFKYSAMTGVEKGWFDNHCNDLPQCPALNSTEKATLNNGANVVDWLRGQQQYADDSIMRAYAATDHTPSGLSGPIPIVLGDIASSKPAFLRDPRKKYTVSGYNQFVIDNQARPATVFAAANDGMLHAFSGATGEELWGYAPRMTMKKLYLQASTRYGTNHQYTTDGSPELGDVQIGGVWKTILVAGLNGGGRGFYALDVTDPLNPKALWELCADATVCSGSNLDTDIGLTFGNAQFGMYNGNWVVLLTSGYNNIPGTDGVAGGSGGGFLYIVDPSNGRILQKIATGSGDTTTPSGFAKISAITNDPQTDPVITQVYGGDNLGQMWRFDLTTSTVTKTLMGNAGVNQPITTAPEITSCNVGTSAVKNVIIFGTGRLLDIPDVSNTAVQSLYMLKDSATTIAPWKTGMVQQTLSLLGSSSSTYTYKISNNAVDLTTANGWYVDFNLNAGERINLDPVVVAGSVTAVANIPSSSSACSVGGSSNVYQVDACTGSFLVNNERVGSDVVAGRTLSATSAAVGFIMIRLPTGVLKMVTTTADGRTITSNGPSNLGLPAAKSGWRQVR